ncbi:MAG: hypothetical protein ABL999_10555 [Pyrinomonadaceae bacterium]
MKKEQYLEIAKKYGDCSSWAVWADVGLTPKSNIGDLSVFDHRMNPSLLNQLNPNRIMVGLNIARPLDGIFANFHDGKSMSQDYKIRHAFKDTCFHGAYMTDIIKYLPCKDSREVVRYLNASPSFERESASKFEKELSDVSTEDPLIIAFGNDAFAVVTKYFGQKFRIAKVTHYSHQINKEDYRKHVAEILARF